jgi:hypothetical protein
VTKIHSADALKKSSQVLPAVSDSIQGVLIGSYGTRSQGIAAALAQTPSGASGYPHISVQASESPPQIQGKWVTQEERGLIGQNNTFSALNTREAWQYHVTPIG